MTNRVIPDCSPRALCPRLEIAWNIAVAPDAVWWQSPLAAPLISGTGCTYVLVRVRVGQASVTPQCINQPSY